MRVNPNSELVSATGVPARTPASAPSLGEDRLTVGSADNLNQALAETPAVRPDEVARARTLIQDPSYPPTVIIQKLSDLLAIGLDRTSEV